MRDKLIAITKKIKLYSLIKSLLDSRYLYHSLQGCITDPVTRKKFSRLEASIYRKIGFKSTPISQASLQIISSLESSGLVMNPISLDKFASSLHDYVTTLSCHDPSNRSIPNFTYDTPPPGVKIGFVKCEDLIYAPGLFDLVGSKALIDVASGFFGAQCKVDYIGAWWSYPQDDKDASGQFEPDVTQLFHRDIDTLNALKFFIYLTDVNDENGPHLVIPGSQNFKFKTFKDKKHSDDEVIDFCNKNNLKLFRITGKKGSNFFEDVFNLHRGTTPVKGRRLIFEVIYSLTQTPFGPKAPFGDLSIIKKLNNDVPQKKYFSNIIKY